MKKNILKFNPCTTTWSEVLNNPKDIEITQINTGDFIVKKNTMIMTDDTSDVRLPVYCYLIKHKNRHYLIDTGLDMAFQKKEYGSQKSFMGISKGRKGYQSKNQSISEYLKQNDIKLDGIFISHLHFDHTAGLLDLDEYNSCIMAQTEPYDETPPAHYGDYLRISKNIIS